MTYVFRLLWWSLPNHDLHIHYASRHNRTRDTVKLTVCLSVCVCVHLPQQYFYLFYHQRSASCPMAECTMWTTRVRPLNGRTLVAPWWTSCPCRRAGRWGILNKESSTLLIITQGPQPFKVISMSTIESKAFNTVFASFSNINYLYYSILVYP